MTLDLDFGITGYTDRWTYRPGDSVALHLSAREGGRAEVRLHRFRRLDPEGGDFALRADPVDVSLSGVEVQPQRTRIGSWMEADLPDGTGAGGLTLAFLVRPSCDPPGESGLAELSGAEASLALYLRPGGRIEAELRSAGTTEQRVELAAPLPPGRWSACVLSVAADTGRVSLALRDRGDIHIAGGDPARLLPAFRRLTLAAAATVRGFDGRIEAPVLWQHALAPEAALARLDAFADGSGPEANGLVAAWDFSCDIGSDRACDAGPLGLDARLCNLPQRAVRGSRWSGGEQDWKRAPREYAAIHFHGDDLNDAGWEVAARLDLPADLPSGLYLVEVAGAAGRDVLPIFVTPRERGGAKLAWVAPTFTYLAYANDRCLLHGANPEVLANRLLVLTRGDCELAARPEYGLSLYDTHADGSGVAFASRRRPCLTMRHTQRAWQGAIGSGLWNFTADLLVLSWLDREGLDFEIVTDDELDAEDGALDAYRCVLTGSHPEYHTSRSLDAFERHLERGGRLIYLGGNGFYWRVATSAAFPETIELRRAEDGNRSWAADSGEYYHAFDGTYGGLWRRNGRAPQALVGVGYAGQGFFRSHPFRLTEACRDPRLGFLFAEPPQPGAALGDFGFSGGGAAGIEIDRADAALGTPEHALVLACADHLDDSFVLANEEVLVNRPTVVGSLAPQLRADLTFFETEAGGAVLSTGSVAWAGSLGDPRAGNDVAELTRRAVARFLDPTPFAPPGRGAPKTEKASHAG